MKIRILKVLGISTAVVALGLFATVPPAAGAESGCPEGGPLELMDGTGRDAGRGLQDGSGREAGRGREDGSGREAGRGQQDGSGRETGRGLRDGSGGGC